MDWHRFYPNVLDCEFLGFGQNFDNFKVEFSRGFVNLIFQDRIHPSNSKLQPKVPPVCSEWFLEVFPLF